MLLWGGHSDGLHDRKTGNVNKNKQNNDRNIKDKKMIDGIMASWLEDGTQKDDDN